MKLSLALPSLIVGLHVSATSSQLIVPYIFGKDTLAPRGQAPIMSEPSGPTSSQPPPSGDVIISDVIGKDTGINIFAGFTRDIEEVSKRLEDHKRNTTVLAPLNSELQKLPRKPWEDPKDYGKMGTNAYVGEDGVDRAHENLKRFVEAHLVPSSPWEEGQRVRNLAGGEMWWEQKDGQKIVSSILLGRILHPPLTRSVYD